MPDNPRIPGNPSDIPSSRSSEGGSGSAASGPPGYNSGSQPPASPGNYSGNFHTRNIVIGAIATVIASTTVYYLTQYVNNKKADSIPNHLVMKEATTNAWKRYVTMDNIYYKAAMGLADDDIVLSNPDKYLEEITKEAGIFKKDAGEIAKEKNVDPALKTMLTRRIDRQTEFIEMINSFSAKVKAIDNSAASKEIKDKKMTAEYDVALSAIKRLYQRAGTEIEELTKTLSATYAISFDPDEVMIYADYKKGISGPDSLEEDTATSTNFATNVNAKTLIGKWIDNDHKISLHQNGSMSYSLNDDDQATGSWKIENDKLQLNAINSLSKQKKILLFNMSNITANSFTITLDTKPFNTHHFRREKDK